MAPVLGEFPPWHPEPHAHSLCASGGAGKGRRHGGAASLGRTGSPQWGLGSEGSRPRCGQAFLQTPERENESTRLLKRQSRPPRLLRLHQSPGPSALGCSAGAPPPLGPLFRQSAGSSLAFEKGFGVNDVKLCSVLQFACLEVMITHSRKQLRKFCICGAPNLEISALVTLSENLRQRTLSF